MTCCDWHFRFLKAFVENLCRLNSDHCPILVRCSGVKRQRGAHSFRFQATWITSRLFGEVVQNTWSRGCPHVINCLSEVREDAQKFNFDVFGNIFKRKKHLEVRI